MVNYKGKVALVTGASSGIGEAYARELAARGSHVIVVARSKDKLETLAKELKDSCGVNTYALASDLSKPEAARELAEQIKALGLKVNILINNAGFGTHGRFEETPIDRYREMVDLNISSLMDMTAQFLPYMQQQKDGIIVNVSSFLGFYPFPYMGAYAATKAFVLSFSESLWAENRHLGIQVLALCPGATKTGFFDVVGTTDMPGGVTGTPQSVVRTAFRGLEKNRSYVVDGIGNYWTANLSRIFTRKFMASFSERLARPKANN
ncbi:SDR family NAD(P)-dependent oxidoreductase [Paenibacillus nuruki]|uniref:SDR family NAD(P)-dependent oxidoreductase n=1 Tax=Paenibacillus nuruki TaxID=1886670 RepID=UPI0028041F18|nr:SDR family oxidoreductase [Paenibacillus nuruki]CAJ1316836.1 SDR family oxidoreductase [Paenibacillus nuruki]